jgi:hypothetical protein
MCRLGLIRTLIVIATSLATFARSEEVAQRATRLSRDDWKRLGIVTERGR